MSEAPFFHVGILVPDLAEAMDRFSTILGLDFAEPTYSHVPQLDEGGTQKEWDVHLTYSTQGPPHIELIQAAGDGAYGAHHGYGLHHIGAWTEDCSVFMDRLAARGVGTEAVFRDGPANLGGYFDPAALYGVRFEVSPTSIRDGWKDWIAGGSGFM
jgi:catechol 2,3-dioxygenase-like lactoylglutathione lyase family enzyme